MPFLIVFIAFFLNIHSLFALDLGWAWENLNFSHVQITKKGIVKNREFYLNETGRWNLDEELSAFRFKIEATLSSGVTNQALCRFPIRSYWVWKHHFQKSLKDFQVLLRTCVDLNQFLNEFAIENASLVFTSYYSYAAASLFGHTFLRLERAKELGFQGQELLDIGVSFGAEVTTQNPFLYAWDGLMGNFFGVVTAVPYYYKVREYQSFEKRDLWSYRLIMSEEEKIFFLWQLWELGSSKLEYSFFFRNCSDLALRVIQNVKLVNHADRKSLEIWNKDFPFYIVPVDTIKALQKLNFLEPPIFRPGQEKVWQRNYEKLTEKNKVELRHLLEREDVKSWLKGYQGPASSLNEILESYVHYLDFARANEILKQDQNTLNERHQALVTRSKLETPSSQAAREILQPQENDYPPEMVHGTRRFTLFGKYHQSSSSLAPREGVGLQYRFAFHDALDPAKGTIPGMSLEFLSLKSIYDANRKKIYLEEIQLLNLMTFSAWKFWRHNPNYQVRVWWDQESYQNICEQCPALHFSMSIGAAKDFHWPVGEGLFFFHLNQRFSWIDESSDALLWLAGPRAGVLWWPAGNFSWQLDMMHGQYLGHSTTWYDFFSSELRWHSNKDHSWFMKSELKNELWAMELGTHLFY